MSVVYRHHDLSLHRFVITRTFTMRHLADGPLVYEGCRLSFSLPRRVSKQTAIVSVSRGLVPSRPVSSDERITIDFIGNDRESASSIEHTQVIKKRRILYPKCKLQLSYMDSSAHHVRYRCRIVGVLSE